MTNTVRETNNKDDNARQNRRSFLGFLTKVPLITAALVACRKDSDVVTIPKQHVLINDFHIAGFRYYDGAKEIHALVPGAILKLSAEPTNPYDTFAVEIFHGASKLGYVPRFCNRHLSRMLLEGVKLNCEIQFVIPKAPPWETVAVNVYLPHPKPLCEDELKA